MTAHHPVDIHVGARLRARRNALELSQEALGASVGITFQQCQKYEKGSNRVSASRLYEFAHVLGVEIGFFFEGMPRNVLRHGPLAMPKSGRGRRSK